MNSVQKWFLWARVWGLIFCFSSLYFFGAFLCLRIWYWDLDRLAGLGWGHRFRIWVGVIFDFAYGAW